MTWLDFWTLLLVLTLGLFSVLAVVVAIGGYFDIRRMLRSLAQHEEDRKIDAGSQEKEQ